jgi:hypothetical protein
MPTAEPLELLDSNGVKADSYAMRRHSGAAGGALAASIAVTVVGCGHGSRRVLDRPAGPHPPALAAAGKSISAAKSHQARASRRVPLHQPDGALCLRGGMITVSQPYVMTSWYVPRPGKYEKVRYRPVLYTWSSGKWRLYKAGTLWGGAANKDGLFTFGSGLGSYHWVPLTAKDPSGKSFSGLGPGYYRASVQFIWPAAKRSVTEPAGSHYYWDSGDTAEYCTFT